MLHTWAPRALAVITTVSICAGPAIAGDLLFVEVSAPAGVDVVHDVSGFSHANYTGGGAAGDFNNDGSQDLFVISGGDLGKPDRLFINDGKGGFTDEAAMWGLSTPHRGKGAAVGDFNGDGWLDLYVTSAGPTTGTAPGHHKLYRNNGNGTFTNVAATAGVDTTTTSSQDGFGATFGDYDLDGDLDLFVAGFADNNSGSRLFRNDGNESFTDVTDQIGLFDDTSIQMRSFAPRLVDMDGDRYPDLLIASDFGTSRYFRNNTDGTFSDVTEAAGAGDDENGMGQAVGDWNGDGRLDWYVTSIYLPPASWTGNKLYLNMAAHVYVDSAAALGADDGGYGWGALAVDFDHDGRLDIAETNGDASSGSTFDDEQSYLFMQNALGHFDETAMDVGFVHTGRGRGMVNFDYDNDGDQDVVILAYNQQLRLFRNDLSGSDVNWLRVFLDTSAAPGLAPGGYGAVVSVTVSGVTQIRAMTSGDNFLSHSELSAHFGLGSVATVDELRVDWPDGSSAVMVDVPANQTLTICAGVVACDTCPGDLDGDGAIAFPDLTGLLGSWGPCPGCSADLDRNDDVGFSDLSALLSVWGPCS